MNPNAMKNPTTIERKSDREIVVTRTFNGPPRIVFEAWTKPELLKKWWVPKSITGMVLVSWDADFRTGGKYRLVFRLGDAEPMEFFGKYLEVIPNARLVWTNEEGGEGGQVTTVTFEEKAGQTLLVMHEIYPTKEALDEALATSMEVGMVNEVHAQLDELLASLGSSASSAQTSAS